MNNNILGLLQGLQSNPIGTLMSYKLNVPQNLANNPQAIIQHLLNSGQISQQQVNQAIQAKNSGMFQ